MGRPMRHERQETVRKAKDYFWTNGFAGASIRELGKALDLHPGSIYSTFGSKEGLYLEALELFAQESSSVWERYMGDANNFFEGFSDYLGELVEKRHTPCTCMLTKTLCSGAQSDAALVDKAQELVAGFRDKIGARIEVAMSSGEISEKVNSAEFAQIVQAQVLGVRSLADTGLSSDELKETISGVILMLKAVSQ